ncbi:class I adenylate-forming enzyme family protein [Thiolapillus brandeum]|uniref:Acyl-CoA ligase, AMP-forming n=1 Tax=Thiolapillus brandeum TaxID=1076588 RepID=A0A7U6GKT8_9GAMM|nr:class I adenylate-forming enzyme family protein [Thiolapillus brandeum]BAO45423.1 acyl-CoA ligase, AMP-forming [Thiolapillus brandeum]
MEIQRPLRLMHESLFHSAQQYPGKPALVAEGEEITYQQLAHKVNCLAAFLQQQGLDRGDRCVIFMDNTLACAISIYAVLAAGGVFVVVNPQTKQGKLDYILRDCEATVLITDSHLRRVFRPILDENPFLRCVIASGDMQTLADAGAIGFADALEQSGELKDTGLIQKDLAALIYTSGSTGDPKGVMHTHLSMTFVLGSLIEYLRLSPEDRLLLMLPLAFDYGLYQLFMSVHLGATLVMERSFTYPAVIFERIREFEVTVFPAVPTIYAMLISMHHREPLSFPSVTRVTNTAAALPAGQVPALKEIFPNALIYKMYGLTECKRVSYLEPELIDLKPGSVGRAIPGTEVCILDEDGNPVAPGDTGILHVRGTHLMLGYWRSPELSDKVLVSASLPGEKLLRTGDWFSMDEDGDLYFKGRSDDIIKTRGEKVSPLEVENVVAMVAGVREVAVIGVPDDTLGQAVKCFVVPDRDSNLSMRDIRKVCVEQLENFMVPKYIEIVADLPRTSTGKISKKDLS